MTRKFLLKSVITQVFYQQCLAVFVRVRGHLIHMLVDTSHPLSRGSLLQDVFSTHQHKSDQQSLQRLLIRSILHKYVGLETWEWGGREKWSNFDPLFQT